MMMYYDENDDDYKFILMWFIDLGHAVMVQLVQSMMVIRITHHMNVRIMVDNFSYLQVIKIG